MLIPGSPIRQAYGRKTELVRQDILSRPFPFLSGKQAILNCGREALYFGIKLLKNLPETVHLPAYCCKSVLTPFKKLGIKIKFYDVGKHLEPIVDDKALGEGELFLLIHYFGIPQDTRSIKQLCEQRGLVLIEDCAHALPDPESRWPMGSTGTFSIYSLRKQLPVPDGGVLVINDESLGNRLGMIPTPTLQNISAKKWLAMAIDKFAFFLGWPNTLRIKDALRDKIGSTDTIFYSRLLNNPMPEISYTTAKFITNVDFGKIAKIRKKNYYWLADRIKDINGVIVPFPALPDSAVPQGLPIMVKNVDCICSAMRKKCVGTDRWPGNEFPATATKEEFPGASYWNEHLLLLPIHQDLCLRHLEFCVLVLREVL